LLRRQHHHFRHPGESQAFAGTTKTSATNFEDAALQPGGPRRSLGREIVLVLAMEPTARAMLALDVVELSRLQFALTARYHFLFVPLTLRLSVLLAITESVWVMTGRLIWRDMTRYWGLLFGINFAMGVATGVTMESQFGTN